MVNLEDALKNMNENHIGPALRALGLDKMVVPTKKTITQTAGTTVTLNPPALVVQSVRVTGGVIASGDYIPSDSGATARAHNSGTPGLVKVSDDGTTLTFSGNVTDLVVVYMARTATPLATVLKGLM